LRIDAGEKIAFVGPSGSGKTTLLNLISGIVVPEQGQVRVANQEISCWSDSRRRNFRISKIGFVFQQFDLIEYLNVLDNILLPFWINESLALTVKDRQRARQLAEAVGLSDKLTRLPKQLSQGEQQRVAICRALVNQPDLIFADEPTGNLDPTNKQRILEILFDQVQCNHQTLIAVTHDMGILQGFDRIIDFSQFHALSSVAQSNTEGESQ